MDYPYRTQFDNKYISTRVGEDVRIDPRKFINQKDPLNIGRDPFNLGRDNLGITKREDLNDPTFDQLKMLRQVKRKEKATLINVDSRDRIKQNMNVISEEHFITVSQSICTTEGSFNVDIKDPNHGFTNNTKITLTNLNLGAKALINGLSIVKTEGQPVELVVNHPNHGLLTIEDIAQIELCSIIGDNGTINFIETQPPTDPPLIDVIIGLNGLGTDPAVNNAFIPGDTIILSNNQGNSKIYIVEQLVTNFPIPAILLTVTNEQSAEIDTFTNWESPRLVRVNVNEINAQHIIEAINIDNYRIILGTNSPEPFGTFTGLGGKFSAKFIALNGIPGKNIVADYPLTSERLNGNHRIRVIDADNYQIRLSKASVKTGCLEVKDEKDQVVLPNIKIGLVNRVIPGFPDANRYIINLNRTFYNISKIRLASTEFPNSQRVVRQGVNNRVVWQNGDDGTFIYSVDLDNGNYTPAGLATEIQSKVAEVSRVNQPSLVNQPNIKNNFRVNIDTETNNVNFINFQSAVLDADPFLLKKDFNILIIRQDDHGFDNDDFILIENSPSVGGIPADNINNIKFPITFLTTDYYQVTLDVTAKEDVGTIDFDIFGDIITGTLSGGGGGEGIVTNKFLTFRLLNQDPATVTQLLGFNGAGESDYVVPAFNTEVNNRAYNVLNNTSATGVINLRGDNYFFITSPIFGDIENTGKVINIFAKIKLVENPGFINFCTFVNHPIVFDQPLAKLEFFDFTMKNPDDTLFDFDGQEHSMSIEITELVETVKNTGFSSRTGAIYSRDDRENLVNRIAGSGGR